MPQIEAGGKITEVLAHGAYRAELPNGHACIARPARKEAAVYAPGAMVQLEFHPADLSRARILGLQSASPPAGKL
jgi:translation initiation factor IF-1